MELSCIRQKVDQMNTVIVGQGAIGLLFYRHLSQHLGTHSISLVSSNNAFKEQQAFHYLPNSTATKAIPIQLHHASDNDLCKADLIIVFVKSFQVEPALSKLFNKINPDAVIILSHNGLGAFDELMNSDSAKSLSNHPFLSLLTTHGAKKTGLTDVVHTGLGAIDQGMLAGNIDQISFYR